MALFKLEEYESALECFSNFPENKDSKTWSRKCKAEIEQEVVVAGAPSSVATPAPLVASPASADPVPAPTPASTTGSPVAAAPEAQPQRPKLRQDWYQTQTHVVVNVFAKGPADEEVHKEITTKTVPASPDLPRSTLTSN
jgi:hypothetical protein